MEGARDIYMNHIQQLVHYSHARDVRVLASRRFGKTDGIIGPRMLQITQSMPRGAGGFVGSSKKQLYTRTVPGVIAALERYGLVEGVHFGWCRPPKSVPQCIIRPKSYENVIWFANGFLWHLISAAVAGSANGFTLNSLISDECKYVPEKKLKEEITPTLSGITHPNGDVSFSDANPFYKSTTFCSDADIHSKNNWLEREEKMLDNIIEDGPYKGKTYRYVQEQLDSYSEDIIFWNELMRNAKREKCTIMEQPEDTITRIHSLADAVITRRGPYKIISPIHKGINKAVCSQLVNYKLITLEDAELLYNYKYLVTAEQYMTLVALRQSKKVQKLMNQLSCSAFYFVRASSLDNIDILRKEYIARMKRDLSPLVFAISILNLRIKKTSDGYYSNLDIENVHGYSPADCPALDKSIKKKVSSTVIGGVKIDTEYESPDFGELQAIKDCSLDGDVKPTLPLEIAFDYNANVNWVCTGQLYPNGGVDALNTLSSMFVKNEQKLNALCVEWDRYYSPHKTTCKQVNYYYDSSAKFKGYAIEGSEDFKDTIIRILTSCGWEVNPIDMGKIMAHEQKYKLLNEALGGFIYPACRFNVENNEALITAMENTEVKFTSNGWKKQKGGEKLDANAAESTPLELRTDGTDAWDSLYIGVKLFRNSIGFVMAPFSR